MALLFGIIVAALVFRHIDGIVKFIGFCILLFIGLMIFAPHHEPDRVWCSGSAGGRSFYFEGQQDDTARAPFTLPVPALGTEITVSECHREPAK